MFVCYNYADNVLHLCINPSKILFYYGGTFNVFRAQKFEGKKIDFLQNEL